MRALILLVLLFPMTSWSLDLEYFKFSHTPSYSSSESALLKDSLTRNDYPWLMNVAFDHVKTPLSVQNNNNRTRDLVENMNSLHIGGAYRFTDSMQLGLRSRVSMIDDGDETGSFLGDSFLDFIWKFYEEDTIAWALNPRLTIPTGTQDFTTQDSKVGGYLGLNIEKRFQWFQIVLNLGYARQSGAKLDLGPNFTTLDYEDAVYTGIGSIFPLTEKFALNLEAYRYSQFKGNQHPNEVYAGLRHQTTESLASFAGVSAGGFIDESANDYRFSAGIKFHPELKKKVEAIAMPRQVEPKPEPKPMTARQKVMQKERDLFGTLVHTENVYFGNGAIVITDIYQKLLNDIKRRFPDASENIVLEGFASSKGNKEGNQILSERRAQEVSRHLQGLGFKSEKIKAVAYGDSKDDASVDEALNRKVMIRVYRK